MLENGSTVLLSDDELRALFSHKVRNIAGLGLVEMAISTNPKPAIHRNLYENRDQGLSG